MMPVVDLWDQKHQHQKQPSHQQHTQAQVQQQQAQQYLNQLNHHQQQQQTPPERRFILSSPTSFTHARKSSVDSAGSLTESERTRIISNNSNNNSANYTTANIESSRHGRNRSNTGGDEMMMPSVQRSSPLQSDPLQETPVVISAARASGGGATSRFEMLLNQIAAQRTKLNALNAGAQTLTKDIAALDETLGEEHVSREAVLQDATKAVDGWGRTWTAYSKCEPVEVLKKRPSALVSLIQGMTWEDKKELFEQLVWSCRPRETYQLQHQLTIRHGQVYGFDLLDEFPSEISTLVLKNLSFSDLANCRLVSRAWRQKTMAYDVLLAAMDRVTYTDDTVDMDKQDDARKNWNLLCRYQERDLRWKRHRPASTYAMMGHTSYVTSLKDRGEWIISGGYDEKVRLWESATGKCVKIWEVDSAVSCVELLVDANMEGGGVVVAAFVDIGLVKVWSLHGPLNMYTLTGHQKGVRALAINESYLVTAGFDQTVLVWNWAIGRKVASFRAHNEVILSVHLTKNTVYTFCIDATLRVFDIPSRTLLHQVKLFEVQQGSSLQWSCLQGKMFLTATNRKVYVWQMEHLESLVQQQQHQQQQSLQQMLRYRSLSTVSLASSSDLGSEPQQHYTPPISPSRTPLGPTPSSSLTNLISQPDTPAPSSSTLSLVTSISTGSMYEGFGASVETRVKPCLTAVLTVSSDMWCGNVTHHDPPLLLIGSRSSPVKLSTVALIKDIIDPSKVYNNDYTPLQITPKNWIFQGSPTGHGRGVMSIDLSSGRLVMGCTGGSIHVLNMDPAKRSLASLRSNAAATVVTLPHLTPTQMDSIRSVSPVNPPLPLAPVPIKPATTTTTTVITTTNGGGYPRRPLSTVFRSSSNSTNSVVGGRSGVLMVPTPNQSPITTVASSMLVSPTTHLPRNSPPRGGVNSPSSYNKSTKKAITPQSEYEEQEVLVDSYDGDISREFSDGDMSMISSLDFSFKASSSPSSLTSSLTSSAPLTLSIPAKEDRRRSKDLLKPLSIGGKAGKSAKSMPTSPTSRSMAAGGPKSVTNRSPSNSNTATTPKPTSSSYTSQTLSSLSKFIPSSPSKMMMRRRASSAAWTQQVTSTAVTTVTKAPSPYTTGSGSSNSTSRPINIPSPVSALMAKGRNRSDPNLLASAHAVEESPVSTSRSLAKSWLLPSPWNSPSRIGSKK
ncbi:hypothetical protein KI688_008166 [Linnemannia hyalina]|uniref:F-box domain-containing protein n=1 Tax=Linnemannia hyalina TaxID=64524 RepID=A0A9P8BWT4_9FUNG|nr:hypothetical protein KI688_008166 [Linnemannia hyalina]